MTLYLVESELNGKVDNKNDFESKVSSIQEKLKENGVSLIEVQVSKDFSRGFFILEGEDAQAIQDNLKAQDVSIQLIKEVRLVGKELDEVKKQAEQVNYLVEWNIPEELTMDNYLERKKKNSIHYAEVPEVSFSRTYVCEDMSKCLCFYDAPDESSVKRAREAVKTPIDSITEINAD
jgi:preprotein translocase subunit SecD